MRISKRKSFPRLLAAAVLTTAMTGTGVCLNATAAHAASFTTPVWGMECTTWTAEVNDRYYGYGQCTGPGKWRVDVSCTAGFNYNSLWQHTWPDDTRTARAGSCYWGVSSVKITERTS